MMRTFMVAALGCVLLAIATPGHVHHAGAMFDRDKEITITGTIREFNWTNPHSSFKVDVTGEDGNVQVWAIEMNSPGNLVRSGWKRTTLKSGDEVKVVINPLRGGKPGGWYVGITLPDGTFLGGTPPR